MRTLEETAFRAAHDLPVTRAEAIAVVRSVNRWCRGLPVLSVEQQQDLQARWAEAHGLGSWTIACAVVEAAEKSIGIAGAPVDRDDWENLWRRAATAIYAHGDTIGKPCGFDFNDIICAEPFDGVRRTGKCPRCGNETIHGTKFTLFEEPKEEPPTAT